MDSSYYCVSADVFADCIIQSLPVIDPDSEPHTVLLAAASGRASDFDSSVPFVVFQVLNTNPERRKHVHIHHSNDATARINILRCAVVAHHSDGRLAVTSDTESFHSLNLVRLTSSLGLALDGLYEFRSLAPRSCFSVRDVALGDAAPLLPSIVGVPSIAASAAQPEQLAVVAALQSDASVAHALNELMHVYDASSGVALRVQHSCHSQISHIHVATLEKLVQAQVLLTSTDEFGETTYMFNRGAVKWSVMVTLNNPVALVRVPLANATPRTNKLRLLLCLHMEGWTPHCCDQGPLESWSVGKPMVYAEGLSQPASYFACLVNRTDVIARGAPEISHGQADGYYKCLLTLKQADLQSMLRNMAGRSNSWFPAELSDRGMPADPEGAGDIEANWQPDAGDAQVQAALGDVGSVWQTDVERVLYNRVIVDVGTGSAQRKVYFDNCSKSETKQRAWINCSHHGCVRYLTIQDETQEEICAKLYYWESTGHACADRNAHLNIFPALAECQQVLRNIRLVEF